MIAFLREETPRREISRIFATLALLLGLAGPTAALDIAQCDRVTHVFHGGESRHRDLGAGRVAYAEWWSLEGVYLDLIVADCSTGEVLVMRTREERMSERPPFDRTEKALLILDQQMAASPALFSIGRIAEALKGTGRDIEEAVLTSEPCACAALYPGASEWGTAFTLSEAN